MTDRLSAIRANFDAWQVDALLLTSPANRRWASGFTGSAAHVLIGRDRAVLATDSRYWERAAQEAPIFEVFQLREAKDDMRNFLALAGGPRIGLEARHVTLAFHKQLAANEGIVWVPLPATVEALRAVKSAGELATIRAAARLTDMAVALVSQLARPGVTEHAVAWELEKAMREAGAEGVAFDIIVASGPNSALPHHHSGDRQLQAGDIVIVDLGARVDGYHSDLTRSFYLGEAADDAFWSLYNTVSAAHQAAIAGMRVMVRWFPRPSSNCSMKRPFGPASRPPSVTARSERPVAWLRAAASMFSGPSPMASRGSACAAGSAEGSRGASLRTVRFERCRRCGETVTRTRCPRPMPWSGGTINAATEALFPSATAKRPLCTFTTSPSIVSVLPRSLAPRTSRTRPPNVRAERYRPTAVSIAPRNATSSVISLECVSALSSPSWSSCQPITDTDGSTTNAMPPQNNARTMPSKNTRTGH